MVRVGIALMLLAIGAPCQAADNAPIVVVAHREDSPIVALGRRLFFESKLSRDGNVSCSTCHEPSKAFSDGRATASGVGNLKGLRNVPSLINAADLKSLFWDGRAGTLEDQAKHPLTNPVEHGLENEDQVIQILIQEGYREAFESVFPTSDDPVSMQHVTHAIAAFERTLMSKAITFARYRSLGDKSGISASARRGFSLFEGRARCSTCHTVDQDPGLLTDQMFHPSTRPFSEVESRSLGAAALRVIELKKRGQSVELEKLIATDGSVASLGRFVVTGNPSDIGKFKTPSLRHVASTPPYMHDGGVATLEEAVQQELYVRGAATTYPIVLTQSEIKDIVGFLRSLE